MWRLLVVKVYFAMLAVSLTYPLFAQPPQLPADYPAAQYDESKVPKYTLPDPLTLLNGKKVTNIQTWTQQRRPELIRLFETYVYGRTMVGRPKDMTWEVVAEDRHGMGGKAVTKTVKLYFAGKKDGPSMELVFTLPHTGKPVPAFLIAGNARFDPKTVLDRGYGIIACRIDQIQADAPTGYAKSIRGYFAPPGQTEPGVEEWGAIGAWAWGLSRAMDYIETDKDIDAKKVSLNGFSRYAKVAMWAGAQDQRFAITFSGEAGCGGAVIVRRGYGETIGALANGRFSYWFNKKLKDYAGDVNSLPVDWHELIALYAPRPVYIATAEEDYWGDPRGSFLAAKNADPVYKLFGEVGLGVDDMPPVETPVGDFTGYHNRTGEHGQNEYDWDQYLNFADRHFKKQ
jgi:hypothetical protein